MLDPLTQDVTDLQPTSGANERRHPTPRGRSSRRGERRLRAWVPVAAVAALGVGTRRARAVGFLPSRGGDTGLDSFHGIGSHRTTLRRERVTHVAGPIRHPCSRSGPISALDTFRGRRAPSIAGRRQNASRPALPARTRAPREAGDAKRVRACVHAVERHSRGFETACYESLWPVPTTTGSAPTPSSCASRGSARRWTMTKGAGC